MPLKTDLGAFAPGAPLHAMTKYRQWMIYVPDGWDDNKKKYKKRPVDATGANMSWRRHPETLLTFDQAVAAMANFKECCLGFVLTDKDEFFLVDMDGCYSDGKWSENALAIVARFPGAAVETSMSGNGLHVFGSSVDLPHICVNEELGAEFYTKWRGVAVTGWVSDKSSSIETDLTFQVDEFVNDHFARKASVPSEKKDPATLEELENARELLEFIDPDVHYSDWLTICMGIHAAGSDCGNDDLAFEIVEEWSAKGNKFTAGYLEHKWPTFSADREDRATLGTVRHYAKQGGWKTREEITALEAFAEFVENTPETVVVTPTAPPPPLPGIAPPPPPPKVEVTTREQGIRYPNDYLPIFGQLVYVANDHMILTSDGRLLDSKRFDIEYGGYVYALDMEARKVTDSAWDAFRNNRVYSFKKVDGTCFRPDLETGQCSYKNNRTFVNVYYPIRVASRPGDITPFMEHLKRLLPDERDRRIILSYMAAIVQYPGKKFAWAPVIQGAEGNGKTFLSEALEQAVGEIYTHYPQSHDLDSKFNGWIQNKRLICIEDIYVPGHKALILEVLKPLISGKRGPVQAKGADPVTMDLCANFMLNSNYKDALGVAGLGRRYCIFYTAQQREEDIYACGMDGAYFQRLYSWADGVGFAVITHFLQTYQIEAEFNPAGECVRAPKTSSYKEVSTESLGAVEQEILAAVADERPGFIAPWLSSKAVDKLLHDCGYGGRCPRNRRRAMIETLGYVRHPHLIDGRTNNPVTPDGSKTTLFVKVGHPALEFKTPTAIAEAYSKAQMKDFSSDPLTTSANGLS